MDITKDTIIGELVAEDYRMASIFKNSGIDFCCNGNRSIADASAKKNIDVDSLMAKLKEVRNQNAGAQTDYHTWPLDLLADYIEKKHHRYVEQRSLELKAYLQKIAQVHGDRHPELVEVEELFKKSAGELAVHMKKEELMVFPRIRKLAQAKLQGTEVKASPMGNVDTSVKALMHDHDTQGETFRRIAELTDNYQMPADGCNTYRVSFAMLKEYEDDLHLHIHLENNILFPKAVAIEEEFLAATPA